MDPKKRVSSLKQYPVLAAFTLFFAALFVLDLVTPDRAYSELENTTLTQRPKLTAVSVDGLNNYFTNYTKYVKDQVFGRDQWISLQSLAETTLFQKTQSGGILLGREHRMFARRYRILPTEERVWNKNLAAVQSLGERYPGKVSFMLVPSASVLYPEDLPLAAPQMDEEGRIDEPENSAPEKEQPEPQTPVATPVAAAFSPALLWAVGAVVVVALVSAVLIVALYRKKKKS